MRIWFDTEFIEDGSTIELLSIGLVREDGMTYYAEPSEADRTRADEWVAANVLPHLHGPMRPRAQIADDLIQFAGAAPEFWAYYASYDWVGLCQLYGRMVDIPSGWPRFCRDVQQLRAELGAEDLPPQEGAEHNALADALWTKTAHEFLQRRYRKETPTISGLVQSGKGARSMANTDHIDGAAELQELAAAVRAKLPDDRIEAASAAGLIAANVMIACGLKDDQAHAVFGQCLAQMRHGMSGA